MRRSSANYRPALFAVLLCATWQLVGAAVGDTPPRFEVPASTPDAPVRFVMYGDTRFSKRDDIANAVARRALVGRIASENPAAIFIGGDLVYAGGDPDDYETYKSETVEWSDKKTPVFLALGNHEFAGCPHDVTPCLNNWWQAAAPYAPRPYRWYSVTLGSTALALILDSDSALKPGSEQREWFERQVSAADARIQFILIVLHFPPVREPFYPSMRDETQIVRYLSRKTGSLHARIVVVGSHVHNYERYRRGGVTYLISGGGGAKPVPALRMFGELSRLRTAVNFHYLRFVLTNDRLIGTMVRFDADEAAGNRWTEPDRFEIRARN